MVTANNLLDIQKMRNVLAKELVSLYDLQNTLAYLDLYLYLIYP